MAPATRANQANDRPDDERDDRLLDAVARKQERKLKARRANRPEILRGFGASGMVGWSITVPTLIGIAIGVWLDRRYEQSFSWTLTLLAAGLVVGCLTAWYWVKREAERG
ncbi:MAG TPA: AtpZ/AtpI family protein [Trueperaceae bacterium]|nr:AtpZ/AtpI family protein [Trueperaceae bacterium]